MSRRLSVMRPSTMRSMAACWGNAHEGALVRAGPREARDDLVGLSNRLLRDPVHASKGRPEHGDHVLESLTALRLPRQRIKLDKVLGDNPVADVVLALIKDLIHEARHDGPVGVCHGVDEGGRWRDGDASAGDDERERMGSGVDVLERNNSVLC